MSEQVSVKPTTKICSHCQTAVPLKATRCPQCQGDLRSWINQNPFSTFFLVFLVLPIVVSLSLSSMQPATVVSPEESIANVKESIAFKIGRHYGERVPLKSPSTADYERPTVAQDPKDKNVFEVSSYVDSQNGFGAMVRSYWSVTLKYTGKDIEAEMVNEKNWKVVEFVFDGKKVK